MWYVMGGGNTLACFLEAGFDRVERVEGEINCKACDSTGLGSLRYH